MNNQYGKLYFERYGHPIALLGDFMPLQDTEVIVVIPSFKEAQVDKTVSSLGRCSNPLVGVLVLVVVNEPEQAEDEISSLNDLSEEKLQTLKTPSWMKLKVVRTVLPKKKAGVGMARKLGMDEASRLFNKLEKDGLIICFDADCECEENFLSSVVQAFKQNQLNGAISFFEHPLVNEEILKYELFLRYYIDAERWAGFPYAYQTLGSCMAVKCSVYQKQGGMNQRKAGEDFYFLHKIIPLGGFEEINGTTIYPSARISDRVPFGTGDAIDKISNMEEYLVYHPNSFKDLKELFTQIPKLYKQQKVVLPDTITAYHHQNEFEKGLQAALKNSASEKQFRKRFFEWWNAFRCLKFLHFARDHYYQSVPLEVGISWLNEALWHLPLDAGVDEGTLNKIRTWDRAFQPNEF